MSEDAKYHAPKFTVDFVTPRLRNIALYIITAGAVFALESTINCSPFLLTPLALLAYGAVFHHLNPDMINFDDQGIFQPKDDPKKLIMNPLTQPVKDLMNIFRVRRFRI